MIFFFFFFFAIQHHFSNNFVSQHVFETFQQTNISSFFNSILILQKADVEIFYTPRTRVSCTRFSFTDLRSKQEEQRRRMKQKEGEEEERRKRRKGRRRRDTPHGAKLKIQLKSNWIFSEFHLLIYIYIYIYIQILPCDREAENNPSPDHPNGSSRAYSAG